MKATINTSNVFSTDWYGRQMETYNNPTRCQLVFSQNLINSVAKANKAITSVFLTKFTNAILKEHHNIVLNNKDQSFTDGKVITVSDLQNHEMDANRRVDTLIGLAFHEACHCRYSDFSQMHGLNGVEHQILNILEDEGIEQAFKAIKGGYYNFIKNVKYLYFDEDFNGEFSSNNEVEEFGNIFLSLVRYPKFINEGAWLSQELRNKWQEFFVTIHEIMERNGCFETEQKKITEKNVRAAKQIAKLLENFIEENKQEQDKNQKAEQNNSENTPEDLEGDKQEDSEGSGKSEMERQFEESQQDANSMTSKMEKMEAADVDLKKELEKIAKELSDMELSSEEPNDELKSYIQDIDTKIFGTDNTCARAQEFKEVYSEVKPILRKVEKMFTLNNGRKIENVKTQYNQFGQLSSGSVVSALCGNRFVNTNYKEVTNKKSTKVAVALAVDMSGSMTKERLHKAQTYVTILSEVINKLTGCELYVFAHSDSIKTLVRNDYNTSKFNLGFIQTTDTDFNRNQNECMAYEAIMTEVRKSTKLPVVGINFTDSYYCRPEKEIKKTVEEVKKNGCEMTLVTLANDAGFNSSIYGEGNYIQAVDKSMLEVIKELIKIIKKSMK